MGKQSSASERSALDAIVSQLVKESDPAEVKRLYKQWSASYDADLASFGYVAPEIAIRIFTRLVTDANAEIHDAGCGTGLVGRMLTRLGYTTIDGSDFSQDMLSLAETSGVYRNLQEVDFAGPTGFADAKYDAIISVGVYTKRFKNTFIEEMLRAIRPGGCFVFSARPLYYEEVANTVAALHQQQLIKRSSVELDDYMTGQEALAYYFALEKP